MHISVTQILLERLPEQGTDPIDLLSRIAKIIGGVVDVRQILTQERLIDIFLGSKGQPRRHRTTDIVVCRPVHNPK